MSDVGDELSPISFTFEYEGHGWAHACISNGIATYAMAPSYVLGDPLGLLLQAVVEILRNGDDDTGCEWFYEPGVDRWALHREGDTVRITIRSHRAGFPNSSVWSPSRFWSSDAGELRFTTTCDLWTFAAQVRRAARRLAPAGVDDPTGLRRTADYRALCDFLDEHQRTQRPPSGKSPR